MGGGWGFGISCVGEGVCSMVGGRDGCGQEIVLFTFQLHFLRILGVFGWVLGAAGLRLGSDWAPWLQIDVLGVTFGASRRDFG